MSFFDEALADLRRRDQLRTVSALEGLPEKYVLRNGKRCLNLSSNNYLGLANHPKVRRAAAEASLSLGTGAGGSRLLGGGLPIHASLEEEVLKMRPLGKALLFNTGFMANLGVIQALTPVLGSVFSDKLNHASMVEGLRNNPGTFHRYRHGDVTHLETLLEKNSNASTPGLVCTETLFSMDGDFAPLAELLALQSRFGFFLYLDEAHSTGCYPLLLNEALREGAEKGRIIVMGTFGKAFGGFGAYVAGAESVMDYLVNFARTFIFSTALPPGPVAAATAALKIAKTETWRSEKLISLSAQARELFRAKGLEIGSSQSHIVPVLVSSNSRAVELSELLFHAGYHAPPVRHPTVPEGTARLRINLTCEMDFSDLIALGDALSQAITEIKNA